MGFASLGNGEIIVKGEDGRRYAAPTLILHYIEAHHYLPPEEFIQAVRHVRSRRIRKHAGERRRGGCNWRGMV
jgi:hypothetical protein